MVNLRVLRQWERDQSLCRKTYFSSGQLKQVPITAKFGGATGNLNAHYTAYPDRNWHLWADHFVSSLGLQRIPWTHSNRAS